MTFENQQKLNTALLSLIAVMVSALTAIIWAFYGSLPGDVAKIRTDVSDVLIRQGALAELHDARFRRVEKDIDRLEVRIEKIEDPPPPIYGGGPRRNQPEKE